MGTGSRGSLGRGCVAVLPKAKRYGRWLQSMADAAGGELMDAMADLDDAEPFHLALGVLPYGESMERHDRRIEEAVAAVRPWEPPGADPGYERREHADPRRVV